MATVFMDKIVKKVYESPTMGGLEKAATKEAKVVFDDAVQALKDDFENSEVTQEIDRGIGSPNISNTLRGGDAPESLYGFIGFHDGDNPTKAIRDRLDPTHPDGPKIRLRGREQRRVSIRYQFVVDAPKEDKIWKATPLPWAKQLSWAKKIEEGIQGFASFLPRFMGEPSRSGGGIQATIGGKVGGEPQKLRNTSYVPPTDGYLQTMFRRFLDRIKGR